MFGEEGSHLFYATHASILTSVRSNVPYRVRLHRKQNAPLPFSTSEEMQIPSFGTMLEPRYIIRANAFDQWAVTHSLKDGCF